MQLASNFSETDLEVINVLPVHGELGIHDARLVAPGDPGRSLLLYRPSLRGASQMPPLGTLKPDPDGVALLAKWIAGMNGNAPAAPSATTSAKPR